MLLIKTKIFCFDGLYSKKSVWEKRGMGGISFLLFFLFLLFPVSFMYFCLAKQIYKSHRPSVTQINGNVLVSCIFRHSSTDTLPGKQRIPSKKVALVLFSMVELLLCGDALVALDFITQFHGYGVSCWKNTERKPIPTKNPKPRTAAGPQTPVSNQFSCWIPNYPNAANFELEL